MRGLITFAVVMGFGAMLAALLSGWTDSFPAGFAAGVVYMLIASISLNSCAASGLHLRDDRRFGVGDELEEEAVSLDVGGATLARISEQAASSSALRVGSGECGRSDSGSVSARSRHDRPASVPIVKSQASSASLFALDPR